MSYELKQQEFKMLKERQALEREKIEAIAKEQLQTQQQTEMFKACNSNNNKANKNYLTPNDDDATTTRTVKGNDGFIREISQ